MSQFYGSMKGSGALDVTRQGNKNSGLTAHIRGWDQGVYIECTVDGDGKECISIYITGGSNHPERREPIEELEDGVRQSPLFKKITK